MCVRHLGIVLLVWFPGVLHAQNVAQPCSAPKLDGGYFVPEQQAYSHKTNVSYACENGRKPAVEAWWAISTCQNGDWSPKPQCIEEKSCIPPNIPNGKYTGNQNGWYVEGKTIRITCDIGYEPKNQAVTAKCINGTWSSLPVCEKSIRACGEPPKIPHAVIIHQEYEELFAVDSQVVYECEEGYTTDGGHTNKSIVCLSGSWSEGPTCSRTSGTGQGGTAVGGTGGGHTTSGGSGTQPVGGGSSTIGPYETETGHQETTINNCGKYPSILNGDVKPHQMFLKYQCKSFYSLVGPEKVVCYSNGKWSEVPTCKAAYCAVDTDQHPDLESDGVKFIKYGQTVTLDCVDKWRMKNYAVVTCTDEELTISRCCNWIQINTNTC